MSEGREDVSGVQEEAEVLSTLEPEAPEIDDGPKEETARQTVERVLKAAEKEAEEAETDEDKTAVEKSQVAPKKPEKAKKAPRPEPAAEIRAPNRFKVEHKEVFNKLPPELKRALSDMVRDHEGSYTRAMQTAAAKEKEAAHVIEAVRPYLLAHPELQDAGYTESRIVSSLIAAHQRLTNPKTAKQAYYELGKQIGIPDATLQGIVAGQAQEPPDITQHPQFRALQQELNQVKSTIGNSQQQQFNATVDTIVSEIEAVREETDANGRYLYPRLHDAEFLESAKPLVSALRKARPQLSYGAAFKEAHQILNGGHSSQPIQARLPAKQTNEQARAAAVSVRGRSAVAAPSQLDSSEIPPEALGSAADSVRWALKQLRR